MCFMAYLTLFKAKEKADNITSSACGRGTRTRTQNTRFWRPLLYHWSYTPIKMAPQTGLEPVTSWLTVMRSTDWAIEEHIPAMTYSPTKRICSTIGAGGLNFCVRNGNRCDPSAIITRIFFSIYLSETSYQGSLKTATMYNLSLLFHLKLFQPSLLSSRLVKPSTY